MEHPIFLKHDNTEILFPDKKLDKLFLFFFFMQSSKDSLFFDFFEMNEIIRQIKQKFFLLCSIFTIFLFEIFYHSIN